MEILTIHNRYDVIRAIKFIRDNDLTYKKVKPNGNGRIYQFISRSGRTNFIVSFKKRSPALCRMLEEKIGFKTELAWQKENRTTVRNYNSGKKQFERMPREFLREKIDEYLNNSNDD